jgi:hypothetical protein
MEKLFLEETDDCPGVRFDPETGKLELVGKSLPEDVTDFYNPLLDWINIYSHKPQPVTEFSFKLRYFNTASSKILLDILLLLEKMNEAGKKVEVNWYYPEDDEDMRDAGVEYSEMVNIPFNHYKYHL